MSKKTLSAEKVDRLLRRLHAPDKVVRVHAALRLTGPGVDVGAVRPVLEAALADADPHVRRLAAWVLSRLGQTRQAA